MAEEGKSSMVTTEERPTTARKESRKVPGGFGVDDLDDLSPNKDNFEDSVFANINASAHEQNNRIPSLDPATLPLLAPPGDTSLLSNQSENGLGSELLDEKEMERHLNDVESSFMHLPSPIGSTDKTGVDDTYLFDGAGHSREALPSVQESATPHKLSTDDLNAQFSPPTPPNAYKTPAVTSSNDTTRDADTTSALESMSSSPTAAAAARTVSRAISVASMGGYETANDAENAIPPDESAEDGEAELTPRKQRDTSSDGRSTLRHHLSNLSLNNAMDAGSTPAAGLLNRRSSGKRPKYLRSRHTSQQSSISSIAYQDEGSDMTLGADYALQSGGAVPAGGYSRSGSMVLSRSISLGSMASGIEDFGDVPGRPDGTLETLTEEKQNRERKARDQTSPPATPRASTRSLTAPTDTIIARHVRNVQVPESLVKEYRNKSGVSSPKKSGFAGSTLGRNGKNLTLKEQSSTIERLSKENFDLKLKVMFLSDRLDKLSEEGVKEMISENVELKTGLAVMQRDNKALKRKVKELEKQLKDDGDRPSTAKSANSGGDPSPKWFDHEGAQEMEEELIYLRERAEEYVTEIEKLRNESVGRENEKRNLAELVRSMGERRGQNVEAREEMDVWKDLLEQETSRREQADEDNKRLREEIFRLKTEITTPGLNHTTNIYNITKKRQVSPSRPVSGLSSRVDDREGTFSSASTLVEELRKESEQLRHENAELRREVGAQTSMLTSRNREKERLYQEIEDLKLGQRRGTSLAGDSILERSASRAHERSLSRGSAVTRRTNLDDLEREELENQQAELRDKINSLKIQNQDLQRELESCMEDFETAVEQKKQAETLATEMQEALEVAENDLLTMQADRDEALQGQEEAEIMFENLRREAQEEIDGYAAEAEEASAEIERLQNELVDTTENFNALQNEMRVMSDSVVKLEDDHELKSKRIQELEREIEDANRELEEMEKNLVESNGKVDRLGVQQESCQNEIAFLREEQDGDKIKIGDLEAAIRAAKDSLHDERERIKELELRLASERRQRESVASREKEEVQRIINDLNREVSSAKDDGRKLRKSLTSREVEASEWKQRLTELENNLREALGDLDGTRASLTTSVAKLQQGLETTIRDLEATKGSLAEKERFIRHRDGLIESSGLENRKLADMLDKERQSHRMTKHQFETFQKTQQHTTRTLSQQESRVLELETSRQQDRRKIATLENTFKDQMTERNNLLLSLWTRLSALCGSDWTHNNNLINGRALPSLETVSTMLPGFSKNLIAAVKTIETLVGDFRSRIRSVEKDLWKEYQTLESNLDLRTKRLDRLETMARSAIPGVGSENKAELVKLREANKTLKMEVSALRVAKEVRGGLYNDPSPSPSVPTGPRHKLVEKSRTSTLTRHHSTSAVETTHERGASRSVSSSCKGGRGDELESQNGALTKSPGGGYKDSEGFILDSRWHARLKEQEAKLIAEREGRVLDRNGMKKRLEEAEKEKLALRKEVERGRVRYESATGKKY